MPYGPQHGNRGATTTAQNDREEDEDPQDLVEEPEPVRVQTKPPEGLTTEELIVRAIRFDRGVFIEQVKERVLEIVDALPTIEEKATAIMITGRETQWAHLSGENTPESEYPDLDEEQELEPSNPEKLQARIKIATGTAELNELKGKALAEIFFTTVIEPTKNHKDRREALTAAISLFTDETPELPKVSDEPMSETKFSAICYKHRRVLEQLEVVMKRETFKTISARGKAAIAVLEVIEDPEEYAVVLGMVLTKAINTSSTSELELLNSLLHGRSTKLPFEHMGAEEHADVDGLLEQLAQIGRSKRGPSWHPHN
ncbi:MAG: hypothetical protein Q7S16_04585 [bacterium]|nr:hypothetical protein [bacterium]